MTGSSHGEHHDECTVGPLELLPSPRLNSPSNPCWYRNRDHMIACQHYFIWNVLTPQHGSQVRGVNWAQKEVEGALSPVLTGETTVAASSRACQCFENSPPANRILRWCNERQHGQVRQDGAGQQQWGLRQGCLKEAEGTAASSGPLLG